MKAQVENFLRERFPGADLHLNEQVQGSRISGFIIWTGFEDMTVDERQREVWTALRDKFGAESTQISNLITMTPEQFETLAPEVL